MLSQAPISSVPLSSKSGVAFSASLALAPASPTIAINESEVESASLALTPAIPVVAIVGQFFVGSIALTQGANSVNVTAFNGLVPWQAVPVDNTRRRQQDPTLQQLRQVAPALKQIRQSLPMLGD